MPIYFANPQQDLPQPWKRKRIIFYRQGLKIYGQIPYILQRRLHGEFYSNNIPVLGGRMIGPTMEDNYTLVRYRRPKDGQRHNDVALEGLLDWLYADEGFEWAIAKDFHRRIDLANLFNWPPEVFAPGGVEHRTDIKQLLLTAPEED
jgi:hypothetical protein